MPPPAGRVRSNVGSQHFQCTARRRTQYEVVLLYTQNDCTCCKLLLLCVTAPASGLTDQRQNAQSLQGHRPSMLQNAAHNVAYGIFALEMVHAAKYGKVTMPQTWDIACMRCVKLVIPQTLTVLPHNSQLLHFEGWRRCIRRKIGPLSKFIATPQTHMEVARSP